MKERSLTEYFKIFKRDISQYINLQTDYVKLEFIKIISTFFSKLITYWMSLMIGFLFFMFLSLALALFIGQQMGAYYLGFLITSGIILLVALFLMIFRKTIFANPLINSLIEALFKDKSKKKKKINNKNQSSAL